MTVTKSERRGLFSRRRTPRAEPPEWTDAHERTRVLVEHPDPTVRDILERTLGDRGYEVLTCGGPRAEEDGAVSCPLLHQEHCPAIDGADLVTNGLPLHRPATRMMLRRLRAQHPDLPVVLEAPGQIAEQYDGDLADAHIYPLNVERLDLLIEHLAESPAVP